ncbi:conserved domain protein [Streptococcus mitis SK569]|nr:conserved domain protein [Streptococcus mitis SK569]
MKKIITIIVCSISFLVLSACVSNKKLILPEPETVSVISLKKKISEDVKTINKREEISKLIEEIQKQSKSTTLESLNDQPTNDKDYIIIKFTHQNEENDSVVYLYTSKEKQYIEQPYVGIWEVSPNIANSIEEAFS